MIHKLIAVLVSAAAAAGIAYAGSSNTNYTSSGTVGFRTTTDGTTNCTGATACNLANVTIWDSAAGANGLAVNASGQIAISNFPATQPISGTLTGITNPVNVNATLQATATTAIGKVDPNTLGAWGLQTSTQNSTVPTNGMLSLGQFNTSPLTITSGNVSPFQMDANGNLLVNIKAGAGSGGTAITDNTAFTQSTTSETPMGCLFTNSYTPATTGRSTVVQCNSSGQLLIAGTAQGATTAGLSGSVVLGGAASTEPTKATTGTTTAQWADLVGKAVTSPYAAREVMLRCAVAITTNTATTCTGMGAQGVGIKIYITDFCVSRNDAGTTAVSATLNAQDTSATNNIILDVPNNGGGGGVCHTFNVPLVIAANTAFQVTMGSAITTVHVSASGFTGY